VCPVGLELHPADIDLDGPTVWAVDASGTLGYVVDPARAIEALGEALDDLSSAEESPDPDYAARTAFRNALDAFTDYADVYRVGVA
jgi:hypothetical protein